MTPGPRPTTQVAPSPPLRFLETVGWVGIVFLIVLTLGFLVHRMWDVTQGILADPPQPRGLFDRRYVEHPVLSYLHMVSGLVFYVLGPFQFIRRIRNRHLRWHRTAGKVYLVAGLTAGITAILLAIRLPAFGGNLTTAAALSFGALFIFSLVRAYRYIRARQVQWHREWMVRAFAIGLGVGNIRVVALLLDLFADLSLSQSFGTSFWLGPGLTLAAGEVWIRLTRK